MATIEFTESYGGYSDEQIVDTIDADDLTPFQAERLVDGGIAEWVDRPDFGQLDELAFYNDDESDVDQLKRRAQNVASTVGESLPSNPTRAEVTEFLKTHWGAYLDEYGG